MRAWVFLIIVLVSVAAQNDTSWQKYIVGPTEKQVYPKSIVAVNGNIENAINLINGGGGDTVFTRNEGDEIPSIILDFGINVVGFLKIQFNGASNNNPGIRLAFSETIQFLGDLSDFSRSNMANGITPGSDQIAVASSPYLWSDEWGCKNGTKVCSDGLHGFRYLRIYLDALDSDAPLTSSTGSVTISSVFLEFSAFLGTAETFKGWFECSDEELNEFWYNAVYTNDLTTDKFRENDVDPRGAYSSGLDGKLVLFDGAKRDRDPYVGDVAVSGLTTYLSHFDLTSEAARNVLADLADHQRDDGYIPPASIFDYTLGLFDYPLWWITSTHEYVMHTGDMEFLEKYFGTIEKALNQYYLTHTANDSNLISRPSGLGDFAFVPRDGESSYYNSLYVFALNEAANCAEMLSRFELATQWRARADVVADAVNEKFWDESAGAYRNGVSSTSTSHPQDANSLAILTGIADSSKTASILKYLNTKNSRPYGNSFMDDDSLVGGGSQRVYAFISTFEIRARFASGDAEGALDIIRRMYGWMRDHDPYSTYWEGIGGDGSMYEAGFTSAAHGWSTGVVGILTNYILGVKVIESGGMAWAMSPVPGDTEWAYGQLPTIVGPLQAGWGDYGANFEITLNVPNKTKGSVQVPDKFKNLPLHITHNGEDVWVKNESKSSNVGRNENGNIVLNNIGGGSHIVKITKL